MNDFDARRASLDLVTAFVENNKLGAAELPTLLIDVFKAISGFELQVEEPAKPNETSVEAVLEQVPSVSAATRIAEAPATNPTPEKAKSPSAENVTKASLADKPAVSVGESLADPNVIVSLITGEKFKMLKRHLRKHGLNEAEYKARFNLPDDYPMVARTYAELRRDVAKTLHAKSKAAALAPRSETEPAPKVREEAPKPARAKSAPKGKGKGKASAPKKVASSSGRIARNRPARGAFGSVPAAKVAPKAAAKRAKGPKETASARVDPASQAGSVKIADEPSKATAQKQPKMRRMARLPAAASKIAEPAAAPALARATRAQDATPEASAKPDAGNSGKATGAPATSGKARVKLAGKERKKLSAVFG